MPGQILGSAFCGEKELDGPTTLKDTIHFVNFVVSFSQKHLRWLGSRLVASAAEERDKACVGGDGRWMWRWLEGWQISWQVQDFVGLEVQISWQVQDFVALECRFGGRTRGPGDQRTRGPGDQRTRGPADQGTRGPADRPPTRLGIPRDFIANSF